MFDKKLYPDFESYLDATFDIGMKAARHVHADRFFDRDEVEQAVRISLWHEYERMGGNETKTEGVIFNETRCDLLHAIGREINRRQREVSLDELQDLYRAKHTDMYADYAPPETTDDENQGAVWEIRTQNDVLLDIDMQRIVTAYVNQCTAAHTIDTRKMVNLLQDGLSQETVSERLGSISQAAVSNEIRRLYIFRMIDVLVEAVAVDPGKREMDPAVVISKISSYFRRRYTPIVDGHYVSDISSTAPMSAAEIAMLLRPRCRRVTTDVIQKIIDGVIARCCPDKSRKLGVAV